MHRVGTKVDGLTIRLMAKDQVGNSIDYRTERVSILNIYEFEASLWLGQTRVMEKINFRFLSSALRSSMHDQTLTFFSILNSSGSIC